MPNLKKTTSKLLVALSLGVATLAMPTQIMAANKPNILVIMADDIGWYNTSVYNHGMLGYKTPNIDSIAHDGVMFTDAYGQQS